MGTFYRSQHEFFGVFKKGKAQHTPTPATASQPSGKERDFTSSSGSRVIDSPQPAQHDNFDTSLSKVWAASLRPSTVVR